MKKQLILLLGLLLIFLSSSSAVFAAEEETTSSDYLTFDDISYVNIYPYDRDTVDLDNPRLIVSLKLVNPSKELDSDDITGNVLIIGKNMYKIEFTEFINTPSDTYFNMIITAENYRIDVVDNWVDFTITDTDSSTYVNETMLNTVFYTDNGVPKVLDVVGEKVIDVVDFDHTPFCDETHGGQAVHDICVQNIDMILDETYVDGLKLSTIYFDIDLYNYNAAKNTAYVLSGAKINGFDTETGETDTVVRDGDTISLTITETTADDVVISSTLHGMFEPINIFENNIANTVIASTTIGTLAMAVGGIRGWFNGVETVENLQSSEFDIDAMTINTDFQSLKVVASYFGSMRDVDYAYMLEEIYYLDEYGDEYAISEIDYVESGTSEGSDDPIDQLATEINDGITTFQDASDGIVKEVIQDYYNDISDAIDEVTDSSAIKIILWSLLLLLAIILLTLIIFAIKTYVEPIFVIITLPFKILVKPFKRLFTGSW